MKKIKLIPLPGETWEVAENFSISSETVNEDIFIPKGFHTDLASIPKFLWSILPPFGNYTVAAVVHDYLYKTGLYTRKTADKIFAELMKEDNVPKWKCTTFYYAVRIFGKKHYK